MEETLKAKIRNLLNPSYNLASILINQNLQHWGIDFDIREILENEANIAYKSLEEIYKLLEEDDSK